ncbi:MAG: DNA polymerase III subunit delta [Erysipelotrichales bacterium]
MIYTIQASDDALAKEHLKKIYSLNNISDDVMNNAEFDCQTTDIDQILDYCFTTPFFSDYKVAILKNPAFMSTEGSKVDFEDFVEKLMHYIENENESTILIIYALYEKLDERKKIVKFLKDKTKFKKIEAPSSVKVNEIIKRKLSKDNVTIDNDALNLLVERVGINFIELNSEVEKLAMYKHQGNINKQDIEDFVVYSMDTSIFDLSDAILSKNVSKSFTLFDDLVKDGMEVIALISILANQIRLALLSSQFKRLGYANTDIAKKLKVHPYRVKLATKLKYNNDDLKGILVKLANLDHKIKIGKVNKHQGMKLLILSIE